MRLRSVSLISGSLVQDISIGHQQGPRPLCSPASSCAEPVTLLFYSGRGRAPSLAVLCLPNHTLPTELQKQQPFTFLPVGGQGEGGAPPPSGSRSDRWTERKFINWTSETSKRGSAVFCASVRVAELL